MNEKDRDCGNCEWWGQGCQSEKFMACSCCFKEISEEERIKRAKAMLWFLTEVKPDILMKVETVIQSEMKSDDPEIIAQEAMLKMIGVLVS